MVERTRKVDITVKQTKLAGEVNPVTGQTVGAIIPSDVRRTFAHEFSPEVIGRDWTTHRDVERHIDQVKQLERINQASCAIYCSLSARDLFIATPYLLRFINHCTKQGVHVSIWIPNYPPHASLWSSSSLKWFNRISGGVRAWDLNVTAIDPGVEDTAYGKLKSTYGPRISVLDQRIIGTQGAWKSYAQRLSGISTGNPSIKEILGFAMLDASPWVSAAASTLHRVGCAKSIFLYPNLCSGIALNADHWRRVCIGLGRMFQKPIFVPESRDLDPSVLAAIADVTCVFPIKNAYQVMERLWSCDMFVGGESLYAHLAIAASVPNIAVLDTLPPGFKRFKVLEMESNQEGVAEIMPYRHSFSTTGKEVFYYGLETHQEFHEIANQSGGTTRVARYKFSDTFCELTFLSELGRRLGHQAPVH